MSLPPQSRFVCSRCVQNLSRRNVHRTGAAIVPKEQRGSRRSNDVTWEGMRFRKVKLDIGDKKWDAANILVGKNIRTVPLGSAQQRIVHVHTDAPSQEVPRPMGRKRGPRMRVSGDRRAQLLAQNEPAIEELVPSEPSIPFATAKKADSPSPPPNNPSSVTIRPGLGLHDNFHWYWETLEPTYGARNAANDFFLKSRNPPKFLMSAAHFREVPESDVPEVAFVGRSNVGKSSLLNAIVDADIKALLARTSATRGFTKTMNFYGIGPGTGVLMKKDPNGRQKFIGSGVALVDMPGYGDGSLASWGTEIMKYIQNRKQLRRVFVLLDAEHGIKDKDRSLLATLRLAGVSHQIILSKMDKVYVPESKGKDLYQYQGVKKFRLKPKGSVQALHAKMEELQEEIQPPAGGGAVGELIACSSETFLDGRRLGLDHVRYAILKAVGLDSVKHKHKTRKGEEKSA